jgi:SAM-dependent methyltransferase
MPALIADSPRQFAKPLMAAEALDKLLTDFSFQTVLDVGCGPGRHAERFRQAGKDVTGIDIVGLADHVIVADYLQHQFDQHFDCLWVSHVLEHQLNVNHFLRKLHQDLKVGGILAISVPPLKHAIVGGHVTLWNAGLVLYNLILAGFDCRHARIKQYGYNISVLVRKVPANVPFDELHYDSGDIETLARFFPQHSGLRIQQAFNGDIRQLRWDEDELVLQQPKRRWKSFLSPKYWFSRPAA